MGIEATNILFYLTGGAGNSDPNLSLGGVTSNTLAGETLHDLFDYVNPDEALAGDTEYRAIDVKNTHGTDTAYGAVLYVSSQTTSGDTSFAIGYDTGTQTVANEDTAPSAPAITFSTATDKATGIALGDIGPLGKKRIWVKWIVGASALKFAADTAKFKVSVGVAP